MENVSASQFIFNQDAFAKTFGNVVDNNQFDQNIDMDSLSQEIEDHQQYWNLEIQDDAEPSNELSRTYSGDSVSTCDSENTMDIRTTAGYMAD